MCTASCVPSYSQQILEYRLSASLMSPIALEYTDTPRGLSESSALASGTLKYPNSSRSAPSSVSSGTNSDHLSMELTATSLPKL